MRSRRTGGSAAGGGGVPRVVACADAAAVVGAAAPPPRINRQSAPDPRIFLWRLRVWWGPVGVAREAARGARGGNIELAVTRLRVTPLGPPKRVQTGRRVVQTRAPTSP